jgi:hypothetical protein
MYVCGVPRRPDCRYKVTEAQPAVSYFYVSFLYIFETEKNDINVISKNPVMV